MGMPKDPPLIELVHCPDIFAEGVASVERVTGDCVRVTMYAHGRDDAGNRVRVVVAKLIRPIASLMNRDSVMALVKRVEEVVAVGLH